MLRAPRDSSEIKVGVRLFDICDNRWVTVSRGWIAEEEQIGDGIYRGWFRGIYDGDNRCMRHACYIGNTAWRINE